MIAMSENDKKLFRAIYGENPPENVDHTNTNNWTEAEWDHWYKTCEETK